MFGFGRMRDSDSCWQAYNTLGNDAKSDNIDDDDDDDDDDAFVE